MFSLTNTYNIYMIPDMRIVFNTSLMFIISKLIVQINATNALLNQHMQYLHEPCFRFKCYKCECKFGKYVLKSQKYYLSIKHASLMFIISKLICHAFSQSEVFFNFQEPERFSIKSLVTVPPNLCHLISLPLALQTWLAHQNQLFSWYWPTEYVNMSTANTLFASILKWPTRTRNWTGVLEIISVCTL